MANSVYQYVTDHIIAELSKGNIPWRKPWNGQKAINYVTRKEYRGINVLLLPYAGEYMTFKQVSDLGGKVKKGEKAFMVTFFKMMVSEDTTTGETQQVPILRYYNVFHISQTEGITSKCTPSDGKSDENEAIENAEKVINSYCTRTSLNYKVVEGNDGAFYRPSEDMVVMPHISQFISSSEYYSTAFHELTHSTGHKSRLNRHAEQKHFAFGSKDYSKEELVAEIGSSMIMNTLDMEIPQVFTNSVAYIQSWLKVLKNDVTFVVSAAGKAQKAADLILNIKNVKEEV